MQVRITTTVIMQVNAATRKELAVKYRVDYKTFLSWLKLIPDFKPNARQRILTPNQVAIIYKHLGAPE